MYIAVDAIGGAWLGDTRAAMAGFLVGLLAAAGRRRAGGRTGGDREAGR